MVGLAQYLRIDPFIEAVGVCVCDCDLDLLWLFTVADDIFSPVYLKDGDNPCLKPTQIAVTLISVLRSSVIAKVVGSISTGSSPSYFLLRFSHCLKYCVTVGETISRLQVTYRNRVVAGLDEEVVIYSSLLSNELAR